MAREAIVGGRLVHWDSGDYDHRLRAFELESVISICSLPTKVCSQNVEAKLLYRNVGEYSFANARYVNFVGSHCDGDSGSDPQLLSLVLVKEGSAQVQVGDREWYLREGDFALCNNYVNACIKSSGQSNIYALSLPGRNLVSNRIWNEHDNLLVCQEQHGIEALLAQHVKALFHELPVLDAAQVTALMQPTSSMIACTSSFKEASPELSKAQSTLASIKRFIQEHLKDPDLSPAHIAYRHHISTRYLHMLFKREEVSVSDWIKLARIEGCKADIARTANGHSSVTDIAMDWGFNDLSTFYRLFKQATGLPPGEYRKQLRDASTPDKVESPFSS